MYDLHCHILPGVDDGSDSLETSLEIARQLYEAGFRHIFATPHIIEGQPYLKPEEMTKAVNSLNEELEQNNINLSIYPGGETYIAPDLAKWLKEEKLTTLGNTQKYILVELPMQGIPSYAEKVFFDLQVMNITPILAHPERQRDLAFNPEILYEWLHKGVLFQINLRSLSGRYGPKAQEVASNMLKCGLVQFVGSDAHRPSQKQDVYHEELQEVKNLIGDKVFEQLLIKNPVSILKAEQITVDFDSVKSWPSRKKLLTRLKGLWKKR